MLEEQSGVYTAILVSVLLFSLIAMGLIFLVLTYNRRKKLHIEEKATMQLKFESELLKTQIEVQEQTMQTIAADLHDNIGQLLSLTNLTLSSINISETEKAGQKIKSSQELIGRSIKEMRLLAKLMHGEQLTEMGLLESIRYEISYLERSGQQVISFDTNIEQIQPSPKKDLIVFRLLQEAMNNIIKHAQATEIQISLVLNNGQLVLNISDNGIGFIENGTFKAGMGLSNLKKRTLLVGGDAIFESAPGKGTSVTVTIPYP